MIIGEQMSQKSEDWQISGIKKHNIMQFPTIRNKRRETMEQTLYALSSEEPGYWLFPRTTHLYKSDLEILRRILQEVKANSNFTSSDMVHSSSDLGLTHKIQATHRTGAVLFFDGLYVRVTRAITSDEFNLSDLLPRTGIPKDEREVINDFTSCVQKVFPKENIYGRRFYNYYTIDKTNWEKIGVQRQGDAQLRLVINDPNYVTVTALIFTKWGEDFHVYLGDEDRIHQMIAHDFFMDQEIESFIGFYNAKHKDVVKLQNTVLTDFGGVISPVWRLDKKRRKWNSVKEAMKSIYAIKDLTEKGKLLTRAINSVIEKKWAFFNGPRQIWIVGEEEDKEEKIQHAMPHFFESRLKDSKLGKISDSINPFYQHTFDQLEKKIELVSDEVDEIYQRERDLLTAFQTEFSLYAVWFSLIAIVIAIISLIIR